MANKKIKGITVEIGGDTTKLGKAIESADVQSNRLQSELREVNKLLKFDPSNVDLMAQRQQILTRAIDETSDKLKILKEAEQQVIEQFNRGDIGEDQLRAFQREIIETQSKLTKFESDLNGTGDSLKDVGNVAEQSSDGFTVMKGALADLTANIISSAISSIGDLVGSLMELSEATEEYRTMQAKLEGSASTFGYSMDFAGEKYEQFYKYLGDDQMSTNAITNLMGLGTSTENVSKLAEASIAVWSAYGDSIPIESLTESINETAQVGKVTGNLADALNWAGISEDKFNEKLEKCKTTQERSDLIAKTLNNTYGESKTKYDELNESVTDANEAELALKDTQAKLGETVAPVNNALTNLKNQALQAIAPLVEKLANAFMDLYNWMQKSPTAMVIITAVVAGLAAAFGVLATALAIQGLITGVTKAIAFLNTTLLANPIVLIVALIAGLVAAFVVLWNKCDGFRKFWQNLWTNIQSITSTMINAVVTFCKGLPEKISTAINGTIDRVRTWGSKMKSTASKAVSNMVSTVVNWVKQLPGKIGTWLSNVINKVTTWSTNLVNKAKQAGTKFVTSIVNFIKQLPGKIGTWLSNALQKVASWATNLTNKGKEAGKKLFDAVVDKVKEIPNKLKSVGSDIVKGLWNGINGSVDWLIGKIKGFCSSSLDAIKNFFGIHSPSTVMEKEVGEQIANGMIKGIENKKANAKKSAEQLAELYVKAGKTKVSEMKKVNEMTLADEVAFWETILKQCVVGSNAYNEANQKFKVAKQELNEELTNLNTQYESDVKEIQEKLTEDIQAVTDAYDEAVKARQRQIMSSMGLFDMFSADEAIGKNDLVTNLKSQVNALREWDRTLDSLSNREGVDVDFIGELEEMGVSSLNTLKQINAMTDDELSAYIKLYDEKKMIAFERSKTEHQALKAESDRQISELIVAAEKKMNELENTYLTELTALGVKANKESREVGRDIVQGIINGINSKIEALRAKMRELASITVQTARAELDINSPSRVFANNVGKWIPEGIAKGIADNAGVANDAVRNVTTGLIDGATMNRKLSATFNNSSVNPTGNGDSLLNKLDNIYERLNRMQIVLDTGTLVGETIDKIDASLANKQLLSARGV